MNMGDVKVINKCKLDKNGNPTIISAAAAMPAMYDFPDLYAEARSKKCNIIKRPIFTDMITGEVGAWRVELVPRD